MHPSSKFVIFYCLLWIIVLIIYRIRVGKISSSLGGYLCFSYFMSSIASLWVVNQELYYKSFIYKYPLESYFPFVYLIIVILLFAAPLFYFRFDCVTDIVLTSTSSRIKEQLIKLLLYVFVVCFILTFIGAVKSLSSFYGGYYLEVGLADKHEIQHGLNAVMFSNKFISKGYVIWQMIKDSVLCIAFYQGIVKLKYKQALILGFMSAIFPIVWGVACVNRQQIICCSITLFVTYKCFSNLLSASIQRTVNRLFFGFALLIFTPLILISFLRFGDNFNEIMFGLVRYLGEGPLNFASCLFEHQRGLTYGQYSFPMLFGVTLETRNLIAYQSSGLLGYVFYTFVGDLIMDFGKMPVFFIAVCCAIFCLCKRNICRRKVTLSDILIVQTIANMCFQGIFIFTYCLNFYQFIFPLLLAFFLRIKMTHEST